jgi:hypothetical protein
LGGGGGGIGAMDTPFSAPSYKYTFLLFFLEKKKK